MLERVQAQILMRGASDTPDHDAIGSTRYRVGNSVTFSFIEFPEMHQVELVSCQLRTFVVHDFVCFNSHIPYPNFVHEAVDWIILVGIMIGTEREPAAMARCIRQTWIVDVSSLDTFKRGNTLAV